MRLLGEKLVDRFSARNADARTWLAGWVATVRAASWQSIVDLRATYPAADGGVAVASGLLVTVFNVCGNKYRLVAYVSFRAQAVTVLEVVSHAEYSKGLWKRRH
jgi:mRNA interferase HigB